MDDRYRQFYQYHHHGATTVPASTGDKEALEAALKSSLCKMDTAKESAREYVAELARDYAVLQSTHNQLASLQGALAVDAGRIERGKRVVGDELDVEPTGGSPAAAQNTQTRKAAAIVSAFGAENEKLQEILQRADAYLPQGRDTADQLAHAVQDRLDEMAIAFQEVGSHAKGLRMAAIDVATVRRLYADMERAGGRILAMRAAHSNATAGLGEASNDILDNMRRCQAQLRAIADAFTTNPEQEERWKKEQYHRVPGGGVDTLPHRLTGNTDEPGKGTGLAWYMSLLAMVLVALAFFSAVG